MNGNFYFQGIWENKKLNFNYSKNKCNSSSSRRRSSKGKNQVKT